MNIVFVYHGKHVKGIIEGSDLMLPQFSHINKQELLKAYEGMLDIYHYYQWTLKPEIIGKIPKSNAKTVDGRNRPKFDKWTRESKDKLGPKLVQFKGLYQEFSKQVRYPALIKNEGDVRNSVDHLPGYADSLRIINSFDEFVPNIALNDLNDLSESLKRIIDRIAVDLQIEYSLD